MFWSLYQVARCTKIINADTDDAKYVINVKQFAKFVVDLGDQVAPTDIEEGMRVGYDSFILYTLQCSFLNTVFSRILCIPFIPFSVFISKMFLDLLPSVLNFYNKQKFKTFFYFKL